MDPLDDKATRPQLQDRPEGRESDVMDATGTSWSGWAELENDPLIFRSILHDLGVRDVGVDDVAPLGDILDADPSQVLGLILLLRWAAPETVNESTDCSEGLWFANQISTFSCATVAFMNIINNSSDIDLGKEMTSFKMSTAVMSPKERGITLDKFQFVKDVHNSFSTLLDRMAVDMQIKEEAQASARRRRKSRKPLTRRKKKISSDDDGDAGLHFVAYLPAQGHIWRLDGLESCPRDLGLLESQDNWLMKVYGDLQDQLEVAAADETEFSLLRVNRTPGSQQSSREWSKAQRMKEDWGPVVAHVLRLHAEKGDMGLLLG